MNPSMTGPLCININVAISSVSHFGCPLVEFLLWVVFNFEEFFTPTVHYHVGSYRLCSFERSFEHEDSRSTTGSCWNRGETLLDLENLDDERNDRIFEGS